MSTEECAFWGTLIPLLVMLFGLLIVPAIVCNWYQVLPRFYLHHKLTKKSQYLIRFFHLCEDLAFMHKEIFAIACFFHGLEHRMYGETGYMLSKSKNDKRMTYAINLISKELFDRNHVGNYILGYVFGRKSLVNASDEEKAKLCHMIYKYSPYDLKEYREEAYKQYKKQFKKKPNTETKGEEEKVVLY